MQTVYTAEEIHYKDSKRGMSRWPPHSDITDTVLSPWNKIERHTLKPHSYTFQSLKLTQDPESHLRIFRITAQCHMTTKVPSHSRLPCHPSRRRDASMLMGSFHITLDKYAICQANPHYEAGQRQKGGSHIQFQRSYLQP